MERELTNDEKEQELKQYVEDYEGEWRKKQLAEVQAKKVEELKLQFLREKVIQEEKDREEALKEKTKLEEEARDLMVKQLEYLRLKRIEEEAERKCLEEEKKRIEEENRRLEKEAELRAEFTKVLQKEAFNLRVASAISRPYVFSYYRERGNSSRASKGRNKRR